MAASPMMAAEGIADAELVRRIGTGTSDHEAEAELCRRFGGGIRPVTVSNRLEAPARADLSATPSGLRHWGRLAWFGVDESGQHQIADTVGIRTN